MDINYYKKYEPIDGKWYITEELGSGAFGKVFAIERKDFSMAKSALKIITIPSSQNEVKSYREENYDLDEQSISSYFHGFVEEFTKEFELMLQLKGKSNIVSIEDFDVKKHTKGVGWDLFIRMELLTPMNKYFAENSPKTRDVIKLGIDICKALEVCQKYNIVHRDIKPSNIFVSPDGEFKLGDFGVARTLEKTSSGLSKKGTYTYMAPEVYRGDAYGSNVDIYSLGIVMYKLLNNNREPFKVGRTHEDEENALIARMKNEPMPKPENADGRLAEIILKACSYEPKDRYESPLQMREELENILYNENEEKLVFPEGDKLEYEPSNVPEKVEPQTSGVFDEEPETIPAGDFEDGPTRGIFDEIPVGNEDKDSTKISEENTTESDRELSWKGILAICGVILIVIVAAIWGATSNRVINGGNGDISWTIENSCITLTGDGAMLDYSEDASIVNDIAATFNSIFVPNDANVEIGDYAFAGAGIVENGNNGTMWEVADTDTYIEPSISLSGVYKIGKGAFQNNENLHSVLISSKLIEIEEDAFLNTGITDIYYEGTIDEWLSLTFKSTSLYSDVTVHLKNATEFKLSDCVYDEDGKYVYRNDVVFQYDGYWEDSRYDNSLWNGSPFAFSELITNCYQFDVKIEILSQKHFNPYGNWGIYVRDEANKWHKVDNIEVKNDGNASWKTVSLKNEMNISAFKCLPTFSSTNNDATYDCTETMFNFVRRLYNE